VTMLQRTPSYVLSVPGDDPMARRLRKLLPRRTAAGVVRWRNILLQAGLYQVCRRRPAFVKKVIHEAAGKQLPEGYDVDVHFGPPYAPWDQRLCIVPDGDLFAAINSGAASVVTGRIETFTPPGVRLTDGTELEAEVVVTATGLSLLAFGGAELVVDGEDVKLPEKVAYRGLMLDGVPNFAYVLGYPNASWTLKADLVSEFVVRLLQRMARERKQVVTPVLGEVVATEPMMSLRSGYVQRSIDDFPKQGDRGPWRMPHNYLRDVVVLRYAAVDDPSLRFS
jgi:monooxygenase